MSRQSAYRRMFTRYGETITLRRGAGASAQSFSMRARVAGYSPQELVGDVKQGDQKLIVLAEDVPSEPPLSTSDLAIVRGKPLAIQSIDNNTHRAAGELLAYVLRVRGH